ncbi:MAG TPA: phenylalanine--tRNA ligase subunit beta, partial [Actinomycetota bacterium]|nr:phenylalanine--tRNA ligase subunit beta [Actinomycetota bacterium]
MRVPLAWLREIVDFDVPTQELASRLSMTGTAVDKIDRFAAGISGVVVGRVLDVADVPESDKLCVAQVDVGRKSVQVVAGAKNFRKDDLVPVALPGAQVTTLDEPVGTRRMVGGRYESQGMLCSARELGVADEHEGILVLGASVQVGADVAHLLGLDDDVLELEIYPNRPDLMSIVGVAREVAQLLGSELRRPAGDVVEEGPDVTGLTSVTIEDLEGCPRYDARVISNVTFGPSPALIMARLTACGFRPLGNLVDATNYVLLLTGQPLHAFDLDKLAEERIVVRRAHDGEHLVTLDGEERELRADELVIADAKDAQALAGIMGGGASEVGPSTKRVLLESAYFDAITIARTARRHGMRTEASARFERGANPHAAPWAAAIAAEQIRTTAGGVVANGVIDAGSEPERRVVVLRPERVERTLGTSVPAQDRDRFLSGIGCEIGTSDGDVAVIIPAWRPDLEREIDLIEEIARLYGYENIPIERRPGYRGGRSSQQILRNRVRDTLLGAGLSEAMLSTFVPIQDVEGIGYDGELVRVQNPMTIEQRQLRPSLFPGLLRAAQRNVARGVGTIRLFEIGKLFRGWAKNGELPDETEHVSVVLAGTLDRHWSLEGRPADAFDVKGVLELVLEALGIPDWSIDSGVGMPFHPGRSANITVDGRAVGRFGELRPSVARAFDLESAVAGGLSLEPLYELAPEELTVAQLPNQPPVLRDISMWLPEDASVADVLHTIGEAGGELLERADMLDEYRTDGRRSVAFSLTFRAPDRTL